MKKLLFKFLAFLNKRFLQLILFVFACLSWTECSEIGRSTYSILEFGVSVSSADKISDMDVSTGFNGGALAMGLITCMCIFGIVWIEISRKSKS